MYPPGGPRQPEMNFDQILGQIRGAMAKLTGRFGGGGVASGELASSTALKTFRRTFRGLDTPTSKEVIVRIATKNLMSQNL